MYGIQQHCSLTESNTDNGTEDVTVEEPVIPTVDLPPGDSVSPDIDASLEILSQDSCEFERLLNIVQGFLHNDTISDELRKVFNHICVCLSKVGSLHLSAQQPLPRLSESEIVTFS